MQLITQTPFLVDEKNCGIFFGSTEILERLNHADVARIHYYRTFFTSPRPFYQVRTIMAEYEEETISIRYFFLPSKICDVYKNCLELLKKKAQT